MLTTQQRLELVHAYVLCLRYHSGGKGYSKEKAYRDYDNLDYLFNMLKGEGAYGLSQIELDDLLLKVLESYILSEPNLDWGTLRVRLNKILTSP